MTGSVADGVADRVADGAASGGVGGAASGGGDGGPGGAASGGGDGGPGGRPPRNRVIASAEIEAVAGPGGVTQLPILTSQVPLVLRRTPSAVYLVGGAAGPVGGDELFLRITVGAGAFLRIRSAAASIALPGLDGHESVLRVSVTIAAGGRLEYLPEPVVVSAGARHATLISVTLAESASLVLRDEVLLGRHGEAGGLARTALRADYAGRPLLRQSVAVSGSDAVSLGPAVLSGHRAVGSLLIVGGHDDPRIGAAAGGWVADGDAAGGDAADGGVAGEDASGGDASGGDAAGGVDTGRSAAGADAAAEGTVGVDSGGRGGGLRCESRAGCDSGAGCGSDAGRATRERAVMRLAGPGVLVTALANDAVTLRRRLGMRSCDRA